MKDRLREIDFIKGIVIVFVLLLHTLPNTLLDCSYDSLHIGQAVPIFLFITYYLSFKRLDVNNNLKGSLITYYYSTTRIKRVFKEIVIPFFIVIALQISIAFLNNNVLGIKELLYRFLGIGPGNYYFWIYLQIWIVLPIFFKILKRYEWKGIIIILMICIIMNIIIHELSVSTNLYRLLAVRYFFLSVPAYILFDLEKKKQNKFSILLISGISISFIYLTVLKEIDLTPYILNYGWSGEQWPTYFWTYFVFIYLKESGRILYNKKLFKTIEILGQYSWYIFLMQMFLLSYFNINHLYFIDNSLLRRICFILVVFIFSITPTLFFYKKHKK